ncbi:ATP-binding cassette domain-containing protein [Marinobacter daepoensis]|uniref:ATP-binding cassette domain-containing protein n=1 Tax=Marinobacter daepoensis TaxID=262077 RepID=A0ABS3BF26_9GAMM|nr:ATP-binding cassette domain-containing protein [Marinobacter daepoensis]MBN7770128.1 ATP-binding cassette domain-containing protein [Marinobacter daepoensis]MBY6079574.1 ATP-binding cassette domain-containing protein [Marinobacter daepoensis]
MDDIKQDDQNQRHAIEHGDPALSLKEVSVSFKGQRAPALKAVNLEVGRGDFVAVIGPSGAGKSSLLRVICGFLQPSFGKVLLGDCRQVSGRKDHARAVSMVFQNFNLIGSMDVLSNVLVGRLAHKKGLVRLFARFNHHDREVALCALAKVQMLDFVYRKVDLLSGGQKQRVAIARCLTQEAHVLLADEPVASLDPMNSAKVIELLKSLNRDYGITVIANMHQLELVEQHFHRVIGFRDGQLIFNLPLDSKVSTADLQRIYR